VKIRGTVEQSSESRWKRRDDKRKGIAKQGNATRHQIFCEVEGSSETSAVTLLSSLLSPFSCHSRLPLSRKRAKRKYKQEKKDPSYPNHVTMQCRSRPNWRTQLTDSSHG
jgi:hypothetical protein